MRGSGRVRQVSRRLSRLCPRLVPLKGVIEGPHFATLHVGTLHVGLYLGSSLGFVVQGVSYGP